MNPLTETLVMLLRINNTPLSVLKSMFCIINGKVHMQIGLFLKDKKLSLIQYTPDMAVCNRRLQFVIIFFGARVRSLLDFRP